VKLFAGDPRHVSQVLKDEQEEFDAILNMYTYIGSYGEKADLEILKQLRGLAVWKGLLIVEAANRDYMVRHLRKTSIHRIDDMEYHVQRTLSIETSSMENILKYYTKKGNDLKCETIIEVRHRIYSLHELVSLLNRSGWTFLKCYGSFELEQPSTDLPDLIVVGKAAQHR
jgi:hypothetical protein